MLTESPNMLCSRHGRFVDGFQNLPRQFNRVWSGKIVDGFEIMLVVLGGSTLIEKL